MIDLSGLVPWQLVPYDQSDCCLIQPYQKHGLVIVVKADAYPGMDPLRGWCLDDETDRMSLDRWRRFGRVMAERRNEAVLSAVLGEGVA